MVPAHSSRRLMLRHPPGSTALRLPRMVSPFTGTSRRRRGPPMSLLQSRSSASPSGRLWSPRSLGMSLWGEPRPCRRLFDRHKKFLYAHQCLPVKTHHSLPALLRVPNLLLDHSSDDFVL